MNLLPNLIVVGAAKSGTTTLFNILRKHPKVFIPEIKECRFFSQMPTNFRGGEAAEFQNNGPRDIKSYLNLFKNSNNRFRVDISNDYFYFYRKSIYNIKKYYKKYDLPEPKILIILRNPIERVFSMYHHTLRLNSDTLSFDEAFDISKKRKKNNYAWMFDLQGFGMSYKQCQAYLENFKFVKIILFDELNEESINSIFEYMNIEKKINEKDIIFSNKNDYKISKSLIFNILLSKIKLFLLKNKIVSENKLIHKIFKKTYEKLIHINKNNKRIVLTNQQFNKLAKFYKKDLDKLSALLKIDLKYWLIKNK